MKKFKYTSLLLSFCAGFTFCACGDMTEIENKPYDHIGGYNTMKNAESEKYYADLRAYKQQAVNYGRPVAFGWYSNCHLQEPIAVDISPLCLTVWTLFRCGAVPPTVLL